jgi:hypothetical protein
VPHVLVPEGATPQTKQAAGVSGYILSVSLMGYDKRSINIKLGLQT